VIAVVGFTVMLIGLALLVLPGLAFIMIPLGLGIVATEFVWAKALIKKARQLLLLQSSLSDAGPKNLLLTPRSAHSDIKL
jgi:hypothetical protein